MTNLKEHIAEVNGDFTALVNSWYMKSQWGISVGYPVPSAPVTLLRKQVMDWQLMQDCDNVLCAMSTSGTTTITAYPVWGNSPFPQIPDKGECYLESIGVAPVVPQSVTVVTPPIEILQYTVGSPGGPAGGTFVFTPLNSSGNPVLANHSILLELSGYGPLVAGTNYTFNPTTGTITLLIVGGFQTLFNAGPPAEVYTITIY